MRNIKKKVIITIITLIVVAIATVLILSKFKPEVVEKIESPVKKIEVPEEYSRADRNKNGVPDPIDISNNLEEQLNSKTKYIDAYYVGGYPPEDEGVCTDVIWRALSSIDINLKDLIDKDIKNNINDYWRIEDKADPHIDFRRVPNLMVFFDKYCETLTSEVIPENVDNLKQWQPGDIILFLEPYQHVGMVTAERDSDGVPFVVHNSRPSIKKGKVSWFSDYKLYHYRWKY
ncbi:DUF1287 domain-containing protein [Clostridium baratii]|uniref:DUF1287 domain-containing protein n=1 Tax=Clostridium baratii TaxID=1561 RepID=UPI00097FA835|nr:DUF1287 domain-containing protein [Clostridium baratii]